MSEEDDRTLLFCCCVYARDKAGFSLLVCQLHGLSMYDQRASVCVLVSSRRCALAFFGSRTSC